MKEEKFEIYNEAQHHLVKLEEMAEGTAIEMKRMLERNDYFNDNQQFTMEMIAISLNALALSVSSLGSMIGNFKRLDYTEELERDE